MPVREYAPLCLTRAQAGVGAEEVGRGPPPAGDDRGEARSPPEARPEGAAGRDPRRLRGLAGAVSREPPIRKPIRRRQRTRPRAPLRAGVGEPPTQNRCFERTRADRGPRLPPLRL